MIENQFVLSYNNDQYKRTKYYAKTGDLLEWKRNGQRGSVLARLIGYDDTKPDQVLIQNLGKDHVPISHVRWIKRNSVIRVIT